MKSKLSDTGLRFLQTMERRDYVADLDLVAAAIQQAGLPVTQQVLDFHETFAGYMIEVWGEYGPLGIIHSEIVSEQSWFKPMKVGGYLTAEPPSFACADIHMSYEMMVDLDGTFHCDGPETSSYFLWHEQSAYLWEFCGTRSWRQLLFKDKPHMLTPVLGPRLAGYRIEALSDQYSQVYGTERFVVRIGREGETCEALVTDGELPEVFADLVLLEPKRRR